MNTKTNQSEYSNERRLTTLAYYWRYRTYFFVRVPLMWLKDNAKFLFLLAFLLLGIVTVFAAMALPFMHTTLSSISGPIASMMMFTAGCCIAQHACQELEQL